MLTYFGLLTEHTSQEITRRLARTSAFVSQQRALAGKQRSDLTDATAKRGRRVSGTILVCRKFALSRHFLP